MLKIALALGAIAAALLPIGANANPGDIYVSDDGAIYRYTPSGLPTVFASSLNLPRGLAFDKAGNLFAAIGGNGTVVKFAPNGTQSTVASNLGFASGLAFDGFKNLYVSDALGALYKIAPDGVVSTVFRASDYGTLHTHQFFGVAVDKANNVYVADAVQTTVYRFTPNGQQSIFVSNVQPSGLTFDNTGNLWIATAYEDGDGTNGAGIPGGGKIIKISPAGKQTIVASGLGDLDLRGIAIDAFGNIFVTDHAFGNHGNPCCFNYDPTYSNVLKVSNGVVSIFASGLNVPQYVAIEMATPTPTPTPHPTKIHYHGGPLMLGTTNVYYIWYGNWSNNTATTILPFLAANIGGSAYFNINTTYYDGSGTHVSNSVAYRGSTTDNYSQGSSLNDDAVRTIVTHAVLSGALPLDPNGIYFVLTSADVVETSGFCSLYCDGFHQYVNVSGVIVKYAFVGNPDQCPSTCEPQTISPNNNPGADAMASSIAHFLDELVTDPLFTAWYDGQGRENAAKCNGQYGTTAIAGNGSRYNMVLNGMQFLIQENWVNTGFGYCSLSY
jgi:hypothetical protein